MSQTVYLDHAATTPIRTEVYEAMKPYQDKEYGNPSTIYGLGEKSRKGVEEAREKIAATLHASAEEIYFTSGGTESDNWILRNCKGHIVTTMVEHHAVLNSCAALQKEGRNISYIAVDKEGVVDYEDARRKCEYLNKQGLLSVMYANNEVGTIEPIRRMADLSHEKGACFHTDAVQAYGHIPINVKKEGIDALSASAHKFGGPKGVGFLYVRKGMKLSPLLQGGGQEKKMRSGTENVAGIVGMGKAAELSHRTLTQDYRRVYDLRLMLEHGIRREICDVRVNGSKNRLPNNLSVSFLGISGETIAMLLDVFGICVSSGSACSTGSAEMSHVLQAMGIEEKWGYGTVRFSLGPENTKEEIRYTLEKLKLIVADLRKKMYTI